MKFPEKFRIEYPGNGILNHFLIPFNGRNLSVFASYYAKWEHVSVSIPAANRCPNWPEMCHVKSLFWDDEEECIQFHPKKSEYVNAHPYCLHIWKPPISVGEILANRVEEINKWLQESKEKTNE